MGPQARKSEPLSDGKTFNLLASPVRKAAFLCLSSGKPAFVSPSPTRRKKRGGVGKSFSFTAMKTPSPMKVSSGRIQKSSSRCSLNIITQLRSVTSNLRPTARTNTTPAPPLLVPEGQTVWEFLSDNCPQDVVPHILAFAGPQIAASLSKVNRYWKQVMDDEETWRVLCEDMYKVRKDTRLLLSTPFSMCHLFLILTMLCCLFFDIITVESWSRETGFLEGILLPQPLRAGRLYIHHCRPCCIFLRSGQRSFVADLGSTRNV
jgi:hypothetical protein